MSFLKRDKIAQYMVNYRFSQFKKPEIFYFVISLKISADLTLPQLDGLK